MAQVVLPLGYPTLQGQEFETIVYQGNVARVYDLVGDPRTGSQLFQRKLLSDISKMRGSAGKWAKGSWKISMGSKWGTIIYQLAKADVNGYWSAAWDEFDGFMQVEKDYLNENAPFLATYNEPGRVWWALYQMLYAWDTAHDGHRFYQPEISAADVDDGLFWWNATLYDYGFQAGADSPVWIDDRNSKFSYVGNCVGWNGSGPREGTVTQCKDVGDYAEISGDFTHFTLWYARNTDCGDIRVNVDGDDVTTINSNGSLLWQQQWTSDYLGSGEHTVRFYYDGGGGTLINIDGIEIWKVIEEDALDVLDGDITIYDDASCRNGSGLNGEDTSQTIIEFNMVGRYAVVLGKKANYLYLVYVDVDGVSWGSFDMSNSTPLYQEKMIIGPLTFGLHRIRLYTGPTPSSWNLDVDGVDIRNLKRDV